MRNTRKTAIAILAAVLSIAGCGGGGGGGSAGSGTTESAATTSITTSNQDQIGNIGVKGAELAMGFASGTPSDGTVSALDASSSPLPLSISTLIEKEVQRLFVHADKGFSLAAVTTTPGSCVGGGTYVETEVSASSSTSTVGDTYSITYSNCTDSGVTFNGTMKMELRGFSSDFSSVSIRAVFTNLKVSAGTTSVTYNGTYDYNVVYGTSTTTVSATNGNISSSFISSGYTGTMGVSNLAVTSVLSASGTTSSPLKLDLAVTIAGAATSLKIDAVTPIITNTSGAYVSGKIRITGKSSFLYVTFLGSGSVKLELDLNGDGVIDATKTTTLTALAAS